MTRRAPFMWLLAVLSFVLVFAVNPVAAQDDDPPSRVARVNFAEGTVSFQPGGETDWVAANPNRPLTTGDHVWVDRGGRAELHINSTALRLRSETAMSFLNPNDQIVQLRLAQGTMVVRIRRLDDGDAFEVDTPNLAFSLLRPGEYRIDVDPDRDRTVIAIRRGDGEVTAGGTAYTLRANQRAVFTGEGAKFSYDILAIGGRDDFDGWCASRDAREEGLVSVRYVGRDVIGYEDLDGYGAWRTVPEYGMVWYPRGVVAGWAPYRFGHWVWIEPWGWTWVEEEPWGFAPFHYGRWAFAAGGWFWVPGPVVVRPVYAPALVAFLGGGGFHVAITVGGGPVGWFPLGPRDVFMPGYHVSERYAERVNVTNTRITDVTVIHNTYRNVNVTNVTYVNQRVPGGVTVVSRDTFMHARPVANETIHVDERDIAAARPSHNVDVVPHHDSVMGGAPAGRPASAPTAPPQETRDRKVIARTPPAPPPVSYERRQEVLKQNPGRPPERKDVENLRKPEEQQHPHVNMAPPVENHRDLGKEHHEEPKQPPKKSQ